MLQALSHSDEIIGSTGWYKFIQMTQKKPTDTVSLILGVCILFASSGTIMLTIF
jgi:hypothetical protein